jgi:hypothetical protein
VVARLVTSSLLLVILPGLSASTWAEPRLIEARAHVTFTSVTECLVDQTFRIDNADDAAVAHRLVRFPGATIDRLAADGSSIEGDVDEVGRTLIAAVNVPGGGAEYRMAHRTRVDEAWAGRCPLWLPDAGSTGALGRMTIEVSLPDGSVVLPDAFPRLAWDGARGTTRLSNLPSQVRVAFALGEAEAGWAARIGRQRLLDVLTLVILASASSIWWARRRRRA